MHLCPVNNYCCLFDTGLTNRPCFSSLRGCFCRSFSTVVVMFLLNPQGLTVKTHMWNTSFYFPWQPAQKKQHQSSLSSLFYVKKMTKWALTRERARASLSGNVQNVSERKCSVHCDVGHRKYIFDCQTGNATKATTHQPKLVICWDVSAIVSWKTSVKCSESFHPQQSEFLVWSLVHLGWWEKKKKEFWSSSVRRTDTSLWLTCPSELQKAELK